MNSNLMIDCVIEMLVTGRIDRWTAAIILRAVVARTVEKALIGWIMPEEEC